MRKDPTEFRKRFQSWKQGIPAYEDGKPIDYTKAAQESRDREYNTAMSYFKSTPNIQNLAKGVYHFAKSTPLFGDTPASVNPNMIYGDAPAVGYRNATNLAETTRRIKAAVKPFVNGVSNTKLSTQALQQEIRYGDTYYPEQLTIAERNAMAKLRQSKLAKEKGKYVMVDNAPKVGQKNYILMENGRPQAEMIASMENGDIIPEMVYKTNKAAHHTTTDLYSGVLKYQKQAGNTGGITSGESYKSAPATLKQVKKFKKEKISDNGVWDNEGLVGYDQEPTLVKTMEEADRLNKEGKAFIMVNQPVYRLLEPVKDIPIKDRYMFDPRRIGPNGEYNIDMSDPSRFAQNQDDSNQRHYFRRGKDLPRFAGGVDLGPNPTNATVNSDNTFTDDYTKALEQGLTVTGKKPLPEYRSAYDPNAIRSFTDWLPGIGDIGQGLDAYNAFNNQDYLQAGLLGGMLLVPNALERSIRPVIKPIKRYLDSSDITKRMVDAVRSLDFSKNWDDDTSIRWFLNGQNTPDFKYIWHGRGTNRGQAKDVIRNYSDKDVGLHVSESKDVAKKFAKNDGIIYTGIDTTRYPDVIYPDIGGWTARDWESYLYPSKGKTRQDILKSMDEPYLSPSGKITLEKELAIRDIADQFGLSLDEINNHSKRLLFAGQNTADREYANMLYTDYLKNKGVNFRYKNDYEGGGFKKPSAFITDKSNIWWYPQKSYKPTVEYADGILDWNTGTVLPIKIPTYKNGKDIYIKPSHRGRFTALKKRTGHSASWFKAHGTPAQKKMATFALNSKHWAKR